MIIIIDGYNLLKQIHFDDFIDEKIRSGFVALLAKYYKNSANKIIIVFDGGSSNYPEEMISHGVIIIYSGSKQKADDVIVELSVKYKHKESVVVTKDRKLESLVIENNSMTIDPVLFYEKIKISLTNIKINDGKKTNIKFKKTSESFDNKLDEIMMSDFLGFNKEIEIKLNLDKKINENNKNDKSKLEKKIRKMLDKI